MVKNVPANIEYRFQSPGQEDSLEEQMATHCSTLAWEIPRTEKTDGLQSVRVTKELNTTKQQQKCAQDIIRLFISQKNTKGFKHKILNSCQNKCQFILEPTVCQFNIQYSLTKIRFKKA